MKSKTVEWLKKEIEIATENVQKLAQQQILLQNQLNQINSMLMVEQGKLAALKSVDAKIAKDPE